jgi:uncharacterized protein (DUF433 family)
MTIPRELKHILSSDPEVMGGAICFTDTRIPVDILLDNVAAGTDWDEFYENYPSLTPTMVIPVLEWENKQARKALGLELVH